PRPAVLRVPAQPPGGERERGQRARRRVVVLNVDGLGGRVGPVVGPGRQGQDDRLLALRERVVHGLHPHRGVGGAGRDGDDGRDEEVVAAVGGGALSVVEVHRQRRGGGPGARHPELALVRGVPLVRERVVHAQGDRGINDVDDRGAAVVLAPAECGGAP